MLRSILHSKIKYLFYLIIIAALLTIKTPQFVAEAYMRWQLRDQYIVVSLTTTPHRINKISDTLQTVLTQNINIDRIYLCIPHIFKRDNIPYTIPKWLANHEKITILRTNDYGPGTKLLGVLANVDLPKGSIIITVDDDTYYPKNLVLQLAYKAMKNPEIAVGMSGGMPNYNEQGIIAPDSDNELGLIRRNMQENFVSVLLGYGGVAYRPEFFDDDVFELMDAPFGCVNGDDFFFSFYLATKNILRKNLKNEYISAFDIDWNNEVSVEQNALHKLAWTAKKYSDCLIYLKEKHPGVDF